MTHLLALADLNGMNEDQIKAHLLKEYLTGDYEKMEKDLSTFDILIAL